jgi:hypothetical protein
MMRKAKKAARVFTILLDSETTREAFTRIFNSEPAPTRGSKRMSAIFQAEYQTMLKNLPAPEAITSRTTQRPASQQSTGSRSGQYQRGPHRVNLSSRGEEEVTHVQEEAIRNNRTVEADKPLRTPPLVQCDRQLRDKPLPPLPTETHQDTLHPGPREPICRRYASQAHETLAELRSGMSVTPEKQEIKREEKYIWNVGTEFGT